MAIGITLLRVSNPTAAAILNVPSNHQWIFLEGQVQNIELGYYEFRAPTSNGPSGSVVGPKAKINKASVLIGATATTFDVGGTGAGLVIELGYLDNDGYFTQHITSK